jgi:hypothetical protein
MTNNNERVAVSINGSRAKEALRPDFNEIDRLLRGIALSGSPVLIRSNQPENGTALAKRLHTLGQKKSLGFSVAASPEEARALTARWTPGTWALVGVSEWDESHQIALAELLAMAHESRLACRVTEDKLPRIIVVEAKESKKALAPILEERLSFFSIAANA